MARVSALEVVKVMARAKPMGVVHVLTRVGMTAVTADTARAVGLVVVWMTARMNVVGGV